MEERYDGFEREELVDHRLPAEIVERLLGRMDIAWMDAPSAGLFLCLFRVGEDDVRIVWSADGHARYVELEDFSSGDLYFHECLAAARTAASDGWSLTLEYEHEPHDHTDPRAMGRLEVKLELPDSEPPKVGDATSQATPYQIPDAVIARFSAHLRTQLA